jgi:diaminopimelate epimerase
MRSGRRFYKMTGSGNDFVFFDVRSERAPALETPEAIAKLCARGTGVGADGVVFLDSSSTGGVAIRYYNADGSRADLCGNATLCTARLAVLLGAAPADAVAIETDAGAVTARINAHGAPEFDLPSVAAVAPAREDIGMGANELRLGYATVGVPHVVIRVPDVESADVLGRGRSVRHAPELPAGANVNFVARDQDGGWSIRTFERGVEGETLACGTGSVATAVLLTAWGEAEGDVALRTRSGKVLTIRAAETAGEWRASLSGEGRLVFEGELVEL